MSAADVHAFARDVERFAKRAPADVIVEVDRAIVARLHADTGGDGAFSHGRRLGTATTRVETRDGEASVLPAGSHGVWGILQGGTRRGVAARHTFTVGAAAGIERAARQLEQQWGAL